MTSHPTISSTPRSPNAPGPHCSQHPQRWKCLPIVLLLGLLASSQTALASKQWNASPNQVQNNWISGMYAAIGAPLQATLRRCELAQAAVCEVIILANGGVHTSPADDNQHFTLRFTGAQAPYTACHIYPQDPGNTTSKALTGALCYDPQHRGTYIKLN
ncbi:hypothetical protein VC279_08175 [Xanthomonas sp. WHRI 10064A]|uniref:hypothetical protein n=1 Tax=unclassified Xanthomonas TaxID=2643310 RepID=UPI002B230017|nr:MULTISPECIES: hypothetical protein [unclassified Xanthomonas]MEA9586268.1 hypothetical protein [Xanthomonas sp. WHRI 10064B]MEA9614695.1 hypothetical protein [Xanthomonas sp. WHRI 10064A]